MSTETHDMKTEERKETIKTAIKQFINATVDLSVELYFDHNDKKDGNTNGKEKSTKNPGNNSSEKESRK